MVDWGFVFVDDFCWLLRKSLAGPLTSAILLFLVAIGYPLSWKKTAIGLSNTWLGFIMTPDLQLVRMAPTKHELVISVLDKMIDSAVALEGFGVSPPVWGRSLANARIFICSFGMVLYLGIFHLLSTHRFFSCSFAMAPFELNIFHPQIFYLQFWDGTF